MDERVDALVGDEQQHVVDRGVGVDVGPGGDLLDALADIAQERARRRPGVGLGHRVEGAQVVVDGELHVHVQHPFAGQQEGHVGDATAGQAGLAPVVDPLDQAGQAQHVVGHALTPLAPGLGAGQRLAQALGGVGQALALTRRLGQPGHQLAVLQGPVALERGHQVAHPGELGAHALHLGLDHGVAQLGLLVAGRHVVAQLVAGHGQHQLDDVVGGGSRRRSGPRPHHDEADGGAGRQTDGESGDEHEEIHGPSQLGGCDRTALPNRALVDP